MILKPNCEICDQDLPADSTLAVVCSFECTFCSACAEQLLGYRCPNCAGELVARPRRVAQSLTDHPASDERFVKKHACQKYQEIEEVLQTTTGSLYGSLLLPKGVVKAWVLMVAGSGPTDRNGNSTGQMLSNNSLRYLALGLAAQGIASLRYDKRGVAGSAAAGANEAALTFDSYIEDAKAWLAALRLRATGPVSIIGHSEGAQIATRVAEKLSVASVVNLCGVGRPLDELLLLQLQHKLPDKLYQQAKDILAYLHELSLHSKDQRKSKPKLLRRFGAEHLASPEVPPELHHIFAQSKHPFIVSRMRERPDQELATLKCPVLIVSGDKDTQVPIEDYQRLCKAKPDAQMLRIEGMNHMLKAVGDDSDRQNRSYFDLRIPVDNSLLDAVADFLLANPAKKI